MRITTAVQQAAVDALKQGYTHVYTVGSSVYATTYHYYTHLTVLADPENLGQETADMRHKRSDLTQTYFLSQHPDAVLLNYREFRSFVN
jgi:alkylated DNA repair dioxygenase AlkB